MDRLMIASHGRATEQPAYGQSPLVPFIAAYRRAMIRYCISSYFSRNIRFEDLFHEEIERHGHD